MIKINLITNNKSWNKYFKNPSGYISKKTSNLNKNLKKYKNRDIFCTLLLTDNNEIKKLNKKFRKKNKTTDVLSFPFYNKNELKKKLNKEKQIYLGDIAVNLNKIKNKKRFGNFREEFNKLWIHGLVHLLGYDHKKDSDFYKMTKIEKKFLSFIG